MLIAVGSLILIAVAGAFLIAPKRLPAAALSADHAPDLVNGEAMFQAGNCSACHMTPGQNDRRRLAGGLELTSPFGTFVAPNISSDATYGVGGWTELEFVNAMARGVDRRGRHLYPAFPYTSYSLMTTSDLRDLFAYLKTLPPEAARNARHKLPFPYNMRWAVGAWKLLYFHPEAFTPDPDKSEEWNRGRYLAEGPAHCASCHTPRDLLGGPDLKARYAGAPNLEVGGRFASNITSHKDGIGDWSEADLAEFLKTGTDICFNEPEGMRSVLASTSLYSDADLAALAAYIHALPPKPGNGDKKPC
ncbi:MAG: c-type cytochrome [Amphiplicatus sp.]